MLMIMIILGYILTQMGAPTLIWVAYGFGWIAWLIKVGKAVKDGDFS